MKTWLTLLLLSLAFTGCNSGVQTSINEPTPKSQKVLSGATEMDTDVAYEIIKSEQYPVDTRGEKQTLVFHSDDASEVEAFEALYVTLTDEIAPSFEGIMIVAQMGEKRTGGYSINVDTIKDAGRFIEVTLLSTSPSGLATMALTNPYIMINIPQTHKAVKITNK